MDKIWAKFNFWPWPPVARFLLTFAHKWPKKGIMGRKWRKWNKFKIWFELNTEFPKNQCVVALYWTDFYNKTIPTKARKITDLFIWLKALLASITEWNTVCNNNNYNNNDNNSINQLSQEIVPESFDAFF